MDASELIALKSLLADQPIAALATLHGGEPAVSMVPFAMLSSGTGFVIHVSRLATHTGDMIAHPNVALLVTTSPTQGTSPLALPRVSIQGQARKCPSDAADYEEARRTYLAKLPDAEELFAFSDFSLFIVEPKSIRYVAGFGRAMSLTPERLRAVMSSEA